MYHLISIILFWLYWAVALGTGILLVWELMRQKDWKLQLTAAIAVIPFILRVFLIK